MTAETTERQETQGPETGNLAIHAENILPIIKQWLYSDKEIFLRELVSNAVDAITKRKHLAVTRADVAADGGYRVDVKVDRLAKTLTIRDNGIGMTADEVKQYINQIAFSGAKEFLSKYQVQDEQSQIIGHFGLGFYSAFMVAGKVEIHTKSAVEDAPAVHWSCDGGMTFTMGASDRQEAGTDVVLHLSDEARDYLETATLKGIIRKYCNFLPVEIRLDGETVNEQTPLWTKSPSSLKDEDYLAFYRKHFPMQPDPLLWVHLNVDYPFRLQGLLYFPKLQHEMSLADSQVQLYCNQVYVSNQTQDLMPRFLTVLQGMIDCPDIPLNVSRSMLQNDPYVRKIASHVTKKVADKLKGMANTERETFEAIWDDIHLFVKFGVLDDDKFAEAIEPTVIYKSTAGGYTTLADYLARNKDKHENVVYYVGDPDRQASYVELFRQQGLEAVYLSGMIDTHFVAHLERKHLDVKFRSIDAEVNQALLDPDAKSQLVDANNETADDKLKSLFESVLKQGDSPLEIRVEALKAPEMSGLILEKEELRRLKEMNSLFAKQDLPFANQHTFVVNSSNPVVKHLRSLMAEPDKEADAKLLVEYLYDLARVAHRGLEGPEMVKFLERSHKVLGLVVDR